MIRRSARIIALQESKTGGKIVHQEDQNEEVVLEIQHLRLTDKQSPSIQDGQNASSAMESRSDRDLQARSTVDALYIAELEAALKAERERAAALKAERERAEAELKAERERAEAEKAERERAERFNAAMVACSEELSDISSELSDISASIANKINPYTAMTSALPELADLTSLASATSSSAESVEVKNVCRNRDFKKKQMEFTRSKRKEFSQREMIETFPSAPSASGLRTAASEFDISSILQWTVFFVLNRLLEFAGVESASVRHSEAKAQADASSFIIATMQCLLLYEIKRHSLTNYGADLFLNCFRRIRNPGCREGSKDALAAVQQLVGYMCIDKLRYGILTTYEFFWVVELCEDGRVLISDPYERSAEGEGSVLSMLVYVIHLARKSVEDSRPFIPPTLPRVNIVGSKPAGSEPRGDQGPAGDRSDDKENQGPRNRKGAGSSAPVRRRALGEIGRKAVSKTQAAAMSAGKTQAAAVSTGDEWGLKASEFNVVRYLAHRRDCITFQVQLEGSKGRRLVAMKAYASEQARDQEAGHYRALQGVEGVPELVAGALELTWSDKEERRVYALVVAWVGPPDAGGCRLAPAPPLGLAALAQVREILNAMHARGVAHGDVRRANLCCDPSSGRAFVFDFSHSVARGGGGGGFEAECGTDMWHVEQLMREARAREGASGA